MDGQRFLHSLRIQNLLLFGSEGLEIDLQPLNVLIGPNASGKSNLIETIGLLRALPRDLTKPIREGGGIAEWLWKGSAEAPVMEAWLVADRENLARYYGQRFNRNVLPRQADVEQIDRQRLMTALQSATRGTGPGEYHKMRRGPALLAQTDRRRVRGQARHCDRLFATLETLIGQESG